MTEPSWHTRYPGELDATTMYAILRLRVDVFVVEQACAYPELDGRDLEPGARWMWAEQAGTVLATLRVLPEQAGEPTVRIGRVATAAGARSGGLGARLMRYAIEQLEQPGQPGQPGQPVAIVLDAQSQLAPWYQRFGFTECGDEFVEDGIAHVPMRRPAQPS